MLTGYRHVASKLAWSRAPCVATLVTLPLAPPFRHVTPSLSVVTCFVRDHAGDAAAGTAFLSRDTASRDTVAERGHVLRA